MAGGTCLAGLPRIHGANPPSLAFLGLGFREVALLSFWLPLLFKLLAAGALLAWRWSLPLCLRDAGRSASRLVASRLAERSASA